MSEWKDYFSDRLYKETDFGVIIIPKNYEEPSPLNCPVCDMLLSSFEDNESYKSKKCCHDCCYKWADANLQKWNEGWRPSLEEIELEVRARQLKPYLLRLT
jgi:hypothetical protein